MSTYTDWEIIGYRRSDGSLYHQEFPAHDGTIQELSISQSRVPTAEESARLAYGQILKWDTLDHPVLRQRTTTTSITAWEEVAVDPANAQWVTHNDAKGYTHWHPETERCSGCSK